MVVWKFNNLYKADAEVEELADMEDIMLKR
jgi:hypothetical protein